MKQVDLVILGAGPAGSAAAIQACKTGTSVALIDKAQFPRNKLCGGLITGRCARHLSETFDQPIETPLFSTVSQFEFFMNGLPLGHVQDAPPAHLTMRYDFDDRLLRRALEAGAQDFTGHRVDTLDLPHSQIILSSGETLRFKCLIGADGVRSLVAQALFGRAFDPARIGFALEIEGNAPKACAERAIRVDFAAADWGYGWSFPKQNSTTIGISGLHAENPDMKARLAGYMDLLAREDTARVKGHFLPFGDYRTHPGQGNVLLAGDAAGFVDPITGEGIGYAIQSGALAGAAAAAAVQGHAPERAFALYRPSTRPIRTALRAAKTLRPLMFSPKTQNFFRAAFRNSRSLKHEYMRLLDGQTEYVPLLARTAIRLPYAALRLAMRRSGTNTRPNTPHQTG